MKILELINNNPQDWEQIITSYPYHINISRKDGYMLLSYKYGKSIMTYEEVQECKGLIIHEDTMSVVCRPFKKFFPHDYDICHIQDWSKVKYYEKIDGSIIKVWKHNGNIMVSTNKSIYASDSELLIKNDEYRTFYDLFIGSLREGLDISKIAQEGKTHIFELCSKYNKVVVPNYGTRPYYITTIDNETGEESIPFGDMFKMPRFIDFESYEEAVRSLNQTNLIEGYVAVDPSGNRAKMKTTGYLEAHSIYRAHGYGDNDIIDIIRKDKYDIFVKYFPEHKDRTDKIKIWLDEYTKGIQADIKTANKKGLFKLSKDKFYKTIDEMTFTNKNVIKKMYFVKNDPFLGTFPNSKILANTHKMQTKKGDE